MLSLPLPPTLPRIGYPEVDIKNWNDDKAKKPDTHQRQRTDHASINQENGSKHVLGVHSER